MDTETFRHLRHRVFVEKTALEIAAVVALAAVYFLVAPIVLNGDRDAAVAPLAEGQVGALVAGGAVFWIGAAICGALLAVLRPQGALAVVLVAAAGVSAFSLPMRTLLWRHAGEVSGLYVKLIIELLAGGAVLIVVAIIAESARSLCRSLPGRWTWHSPLDDVITEQGDQLKGDGVDLAAQPGAKLSPTLACLGWGVRSLFGRQSASANRQAAAAALRRRASCAAVTVVAAAVMLALLMRSADRKQVLFAVFASFFVASLIAHQVFPTSCTILMWLAPVLVGLGAYALAAVNASGLGDAATAWRHVPDVALALPIDWIAVGGAGAVIGAWLSERHHEHKHIEVHADLEE